MDKKITSQPIKIVMVRRGSGNILRVPTQKLKTFIRKRALLGTDEISGDGSNWVQIDHHHQLRKFFSKNDQENTTQIKKQELEDELEVSEISEDIENNLRQVSDLLKEING